MSGFVHLHVHSNYSLREGAARVEDLASAAADYGMEALALTDHDGLYGAVRFTLACHRAGVRPILGAELEWGEGYHITLLASDQKGWANLCRLVTEMHLDERAQSLPPGKRPRTSFESIAARSEGLVALSGCERGEVPWLAATGRGDEAAAAARRWLDVFGTSGFCFEVSNHLCRGDQLRNQRLMDLSASLGIRPVATNNVHYVTRDDALTHDVAESMRRIVALSRATAPRENAEYWLKPEEEMVKLHPPEAIDGARWVSDRCRYTLPLGEFHFPTPPSVGNESSTSVLARRCFEGIPRRYPAGGRGVSERLQRELREIRRGGFCGYFLLVADIVEYARTTLRARCACRGSAAGSLVAYLLGISDVDPIRHGLVFERFMNRWRKEIPDIDLDFPSDRREEVNAYILDTYGERTAMVSMMETFRARSAIREVGKALGLPDSEVDLVAKAFPHIGARNIPDALKALPEVSGLNLPASRLESLFELATRFDGFPRHLAVHPSGVILSNEDLGDLMPMQRSYGGFLMSQFDKDDVDALGIAKLDVLGVRMLAAMDHSLEEVFRIRGVRPDLDSIPLGDSSTFELIRDSRTMGCFQIESPGQRELLGKFQPERFEDLIVDISLFRPGPVKSDMVRPFLMRRHRFESVTYAHPSLAGVLRETQGVIVYHEQVMRVISALCGCDLGEADRIRRMLDGGDSTDLGADVVERAVARGWDRRAAEKVWKEVASFAAFGFCKAHAAAFAVPTYQSAWLKAHYPAEFYCGVLTHDPGMYPRRAILADARAHGIPILPVDVNASWPDYRVEMGERCHEVGALEDRTPGPWMRETAPSRYPRVRGVRSQPMRPSGAGLGPFLGAAGIRLALGDVRGISADETASIVEGRPWRSFHDFCARAEVSRPVVEALIHCGAFDSIKGRRSRRELYWMVEERWSERIRARAEQLSFDLTTAEEIRLPGIADYSEREKVEAELEILGLDATNHLISFYSDALDKLGWTRARDLRKLRGHSRVVVGGVKVATQTPPVRSGKRVIFLTLEDGTGQADIALFEETQARYARTVFDGWVLAVKGTVRRSGHSGVSVLGEEVIDLAASQPRKLWHASPGSAGR